MRAVLTHFWVSQGDVSVRQYHLELAGRLAIYGFHQEKGPRPRSNADPKLGPGLVERHPMESLADQRAVRATLEDLHSYPEPHQIPL
jgi:hypothetical protein